MKFVILRTESDRKILGRVEDDGSIQYTCSEEDRHYLDWVEQGNVAT